MFRVSVVFILLTLLHWSVCLLPAKFQWRTVDYSWEGDARTKAIANGTFVPENNMPTGIALWRDKIFITIPRWKKGVPASLNYILASGTQQQPLRPYPSWRDAHVSDNSCCAPTNSTVVSAFRANVDSCDRLWTVDNGVTDMSNEVRQISEPAIFVFDLKNDTLIEKYVLGDDVLKDSSVLTSIVVDESDGCENTVAYVTDPGSSALIVYDLRGRAAWRVEHPFFHFDPGASVHRVGGVDFFWSEGVSAAALSEKNSDGFRDLFLHPTASTKLFKISTKVLKNRNATESDMSSAVELVGERGPNTQATALELDPKTNILFFALLNKNGIGCWNLKMECTEETTPLVMSDCNLLEFPSDIKVDSAGNLWVLSNRQSRFLYDTLDLDQMNFRILTAPVESVVQGSACVENPAKKRSSSRTSVHSATSEAPAKSKSRLKNFFSGSRKNSKN